MVPPPTEMVAVPVTVPDPYVGSVTETLATTSWDSQEWFVQFDETAQLVVASATPLSAARDVTVTRARAIGVTANARSVRPNYWKWPFPYRHPPRNHPPFRSWNTQPGCTLSLASTNRITSPGEKEPVDASPHRRAVNYPSSLL